MRTELQPLEGRRVTFTGTFIRFGVFETKRGLHKKVLLKNVKDIQGRQMAQHSLPPMALATIEMRSAAGNATTTQMS